VGWIGHRAEIVSSASVPPSAYDLLLVNLSSKLDPRWIHYLSKAMMSGIQVRHLAEYVEELRGRVSPDHFHIDHVVEEPSLRLYPRVKYAFDLLLIVLMLPVALPAAIIAAIAIAATMGRPILFLQTRIGYRGRTFRMYKFRTMQQLDCEKVSATVVQDSRVTRVGRWLRRFRIDEVPQFWNVLRGDMSIVGPRPEQPRLCTRYERAMAAFPYRHLVRPGITGWAQVRFGYAANEHETRNKLSYDLYYVKYISLRLDLQILFETVRTVVHHRNVR
jgi:lipopolysaccharide/colanic/teichoic acid biosynthesis glycosyltransferase